MANENTKDDDYFTRMSDSELVEYIHYISDGYYEDVEKKVEAELSRRFAELNGKIAAKDAEIAKLRAALKPVLECITDWGDVEGECSCRERIGAVNHACHNAVREAQRVMKEGGRNEG